MVRGNNSSTVNASGEELGIGEYTYETIDNFKNFLGNGCKDSQHTLGLSSGNEFVPNEIARIIECKTRKRKSAHTWYFYKEDDNSRFLSKTFPDEYDLLLTQTKCGDKYMQDKYQKI